MNIEKHLNIYYITNLAVIAAITVLVYSIHEDIHSRENHIKKLEINYNKFETLLNDKKQVD